MYLQSADVLQSSTAYITIILHHTASVVGFNPTFYQYDEEENRGMITLIVELISFGTHPEIVVSLGTTDGSARGKLML